jgi:hypothetical protein
VGEVGKEFAFFLFHKKNYITWQLPLGGSIQMKNGFMILTHVPQTNPANGVALLLNASSIAHLAQQSECTTAGQNGLWLVCDYSHSQRAIQAVKQRNEMRLSNPSGNTEDTNVSFATRHSATRTGGFVLA